MAGGVEVAGPQAGQESAWCSARKDEGINFFIKICCHRIGRGRGDGANRAHFWVWGYHAPPKYNGNKIKCMVSFPRITSFFPD